LAASITAEGKHAPAVLDAARVAALGRRGVRRAIEIGGHTLPGSTMPRWGYHLGADWMKWIADYVIAMPAAGEAGRERVERYLSAPAGTPPSGRRIYVTYCSGCHGPDGGGDGFFSREVATRMTPSRMSAETLSGRDDAELSQLISPGGAHAPDAATMPGWLYTLSPDDRRALVAYLRTLSGTPGQD
jgi:mono/diheme cytochrome c family protein